MKNIARLSLFFLVATLFPYSVIASDLGPTASISVSPSRGSLETVFAFDAGGSIDSRGFSSGLEYRWSFTTDGGEWTDWGNEDSTTYKFSSSGDKTVRVEVKDEDGYTDTAWTEIEVEDDIPYEVEFEVTPEEGDINTVFTFDIDLTTNIAYVISEFEYRWDFEGDETWDTDYMSAQIIEHSYGDSSTYTPILEVMAPDGTTTTVHGYETSNASSGGDIVVYTSDYPEASISYYPSSGTEATRFYFSSENSSYDASEFRWDFEGDGIFDTDWSNDETVDHKYGLTGEYEAILQVKNSDGYTDEARITITIAETGLAPEAKFTVTSDSHLADSDVGTTATEFTFNASSSSDDEDYSSQMEVRWDYEGDGDFDTTFADTKLAYHQYFEPGEYEITMEIRDSDGNVSTATYDIRIVTNTAPRAAFEVESDQATPGVEFEFDAGACSDDQYKSPYLEVRWDFDGDGSWDTNFSTYKREDYYYESPGTYDVVMQVKDPEGHTDESSSSVTVLSNSAPYADFTVTPESGTYSTSFTFDASDSYDGETDFDDLWFRWDFSYNGENDITYDTSWRHDDDTDHYFDEDDGTGEIFVKLEVKDADSEVSSIVKTVNLHWASTYLDELKDAGVMKGYSGDMMPDQNITRAELLKVVLETMDLNLYGMSYKGYFSDVSQADWHWKYVEKGYELGIILGYDGGIFDPNEPVNRAEAMKIILGAFDIDTGGSHEGGVFSDISVTDWFFKYVMTAYDEGLVSGYEDSTFGPGSYMTRGEAAKVVVLAY
ncbi:S-layer homology domain-containing protein [Patescibacteria group bacterium]|nr:S-layer homology domain-containing protein [Patescibacteria group bacterium]